MRVLRPDKVIQMIQEIIMNEKELGSDYVTPPPFDLSDIHEDSNNKTPIIIVLSPGADPLTEIVKLKKSKGIKNVDPLSLG
mmetsp:Transcript_113299/g.156556  ORF Transcript_113299/g.156556 Transcript_113299/m.156556 type:complete len:81 (-) Transcript_113299:1122-1364(-)